MYASELNDLKHCIFQMPQKSETLNTLLNGILNELFFLLTAHANIYKEDFYKTVFGCPQCNIISFPSPH